MTNCYPVEEELAAYTSDLLLLFQKFDKGGSLRFEDFSKEWRELNFSFIHCGKRTSGDRHQGTERLFRCISGYLNPETPFQYRVAAIYCAYAVYYTQLCNPKVKIRMTMPMWKDLKNLQEVVREHKHRDIDYVITKLENDKAFLFTAMPKQLEYGNKELMTNMETAGSQVNYSRKYYVPDQYVEDTIQGLDFVESIAGLEDEYMAVKEDIFKNLPETVDRKTVNCFKSAVDFRSNLVDEIENFREWVESNSHVQTLFDSGQRPAAKNVEDIEVKKKKASKEVPLKKAPSTCTRAERIQAIKRRSFRNPASREASSASRSEGGQDPSKETVDESKFLYRRSALIERFELRPWLRRWRSRHKMGVASTAVSIKLFVR
eukprot:gene14529-5595_t